MNITLTSAQDPSDVRNITLYENEAYTVGRASRSREKNLSTSPTNALFDCPVVSRYHAELIFRRDLMLPHVHDVVIKDIGSMHGTKVNNVQLLDGAEMSLRDGDRIQLGEKVTRGVGKTKQSSNTAVDVALADIPVSADAHEGVIVMFRRSTPSVSQMSHTFAASQPGRTFCVPAYSDEDDEDTSSSDEEDEVSLISVEEAKHVSSAKTTPDQGKFKLGSPQRPINIEKVAKYQPNVIDIDSESDDESDDDPVKPVLPPRTTGASYQHPYVEDSLKVVPETLNDDLYAPATPTRYDTRYDHTIPGGRLTGDREGSVRGDSEPEDMSDINSEELDDEISGVVDHDDEDSDIDHRYSPRSPVESHYSPRSPSPGVRYSPRSPIDAEAPVKSRYSPRSPVDAEAAAEPLSPQNPTSPVYSSSNLQEVRDTDPAATSLAQSRRRIESLYMKHFGKPLPNDPPSTSMPFDPVRSTQSQFQPVGSQQTPPSFEAPKPASSSSQPAYKAPWEYTASSQVSNGSYTRPTPNYASVPSTLAAPPCDFPSYSSLIPETGTGYGRYPASTRPNGCSPFADYRMPSEPSAAAAFDSNIITARPHSHAPEFYNMIDLPDNSYSHSYSSYPTLGYTPYLPTYTAPDIQPVLRELHKQQTPSTEEQPIPSPKLNRINISDIVEEGDKNEKTKDVPKSVKFVDVTSNPAAPLLPKSSAAPSLSNDIIETGKKRKADEMLADVDELIAEAGALASLAKPQRSFYISALDDADDAEEDTSFELVHEQQDLAPIQDAAAAPLVHEDEPPRIRRRIGNAAKVTAGALAGSMATMAFLCSPLAERAIEWLA
jgi:hypothetical protein